MVFINSAPKFPQTSLQAVVNLLLLSNVVNLPKHSFTQSLKEIVSHFLVVFSNFGPTMNIKITKLLFPYLILGSRYFYLPFRLFLTMQSNNMDTTHVLPGIVGTGRGGWRVGGGHGWCRGEGVFFLKFCERYRSFPNIIYALFSPFSGFCILVSAVPGNILATNILTKE